MFDEESGSLLSQMAALTRLGFVVRGRCFKGARGTVQILILSLLSHKAAQ